MKKKNQDMIEDLALKSFSDIIPSTIIFKYNTMSL